MLLKAALNGARTRTEHPRLPLSPDELAIDAAQSVAAGAGAIHVHVRRSSGTESLLEPDVTATLLAIRGACPGTPVGISTAAWIEPDLTARLRLIAGWRELPDFASVNFHEVGAGAVATALLGRGIGVEAGLSSGDAARSFLASEAARHCLRVLIEPAEHEVSAAKQTAEEIFSVLDQASVTLPRLLHGEGPAAWPLLREAALRGYDGRAGLEDTVFLPDGRRGGNVQHVLAAREIVCGV